MNVGDTIKNSLKGLLALVLIGHVLFVEASHIRAGEIIARRIDISSRAFEFVFIDADKPGYVDYFNTLLEKNLLAPSGFICVDNTLLQGQPYLTQAERTANGKAIAEFNRTVAADKRVEQVLLPLRDGLTIIRRLEES